MIQMAFPLSDDGGRELGMELRDYFAARMLPELYRELKEYPDERWRLGLAQEAYKLADAMMEARDV
jgi:hypothetical protein